MFDPGGSDLAQVGQLLKGSLAHVHGKIERISDHDGRMARVRWIPNVQGRSLQPPSSIKENPEEAHIPLSEWRDRTEWSQP